VIVTLLYVLFFKNGPGIYMTLVSASSIGKARPYMEADFLFKARALSVYRSINEATNA